MTAVVVALGVIGLLITGGWALASLVSWRLQQRRRHRVRDERLLAQARIDFLTRRVLVELRRQQRQLFNDTRRTQRL